MDREIDLDDSLPAVKEPSVSNPDMSMNGGEVGVRRWG